MKSSKESLRFIVGFVLSCAFFGTATADYSGTVVDKKTGGPIEGVLVSAGHSEYYTRTDANGRFVLSTSIPHYTSAGSTPPASRANPITARWNFSKRALDLRSAPGVNSASVYTINGKRVFGGKVPRSRVLEVPSLAKGTYLLELRGEQGLRGNARVVVSNRAATAVTFNNATLSGGNTRLAKSAQTSDYAPGYLIFRHDNYYPKNDKSPSGNMSVQLEEDERSFVFDQSKVRTYRFTLSKADSTTLDSLGWKEEYVRAKMTFEGEDYGDVGLRYKGSGFSLPRCFGYDGKNESSKGSKRNTCPKISYKVKLTEYDKDTRLYKMKKICLHSMWGDSTKMHDMLAYELFREMGITASRTAYANVYVNNKLMGLFVAVEEPDGRFTKSRWPEHGDGNLYKEAWPYPQNSYDVCCLQKYFGGETHLKTNEDMANVQRMIDYYNAIKESNEQNFAEKLYPFMDFDYFLRYMAVDVAIKNFDGFRSFYMSNGWVGNHNYFFYEEENIGGKIWIIPWDMDATFLKNDLYYETAGIPQWNKTATQTQCSDGFKQTYYDINGNPYVNLIRPPNCDPLFKLAASVGWDRYAQLGEQFLNDQFRSQRMIAKINKHKEVISTYIDQDPVIDKASWSNTVDNFKSDFPNYIYAKFANHISSR
jgi:spore coat protein CotH